jgi:hypothetical protein
MKPVQICFTNDLKPYYKIKGKDFSNTRKQMREKLLKKQGR